MIILELLDQKKLGTFEKLRHKMKRAIAGVCPHGLFTRKASSFARKTRASLVHQAFCLNL